jgi:hypothetical protein
MEGKGRRRAREGENGVCAEGVLEAEKDARGTHTGMLAKSAGV